MLSKRGMINTVLLGTCLLGVTRIAAVAADMGTPRIIDITADSDNRFKVPKQKEPVITMKVNEVAVLRITSRKGGEWDEKDGAIHTFTINALKDRGWNFRLKEGTQKFPGGGAVPNRELRGGMHREMR